MTGPVGVAPNSVTLPITLNSECLPVWLTKAQTFWTVGMLRTASQSCWVRVEPNPKQASHFFFAVKCKYIYTGVNQCCEDPFESNQ
jgi:hypothetical protein